MRLPAVPARTTRSPDRPGVVGTARVARRTADLLPRLRAGDVAVLDHVDLDRTTARALVDAGVVAVVNAVPLISGRFPNLGPELLAAADVALVDGVGSDGLAAIGDGRQVRVHDGRVLVADEPVAAGREVDLATVRREMAEARSGMATQVDSLVRTSSELLRREPDLLLHGLGLPRTVTAMSGRSVVVVASGHEHVAELEHLQVFLREQEPVLVAVGRAADTLRGRRRRVDVVVLDSADAADQPTAATLKAARDVVVRVDPGTAGTELTASLERMGVRPLLVRTSAAPEDVALLLAAAADAPLVVGVGLRAGLEELLDRQRDGLASSYLTRLRLGPRLVDAAAVPRLYSGRVRPHHLLLVMLAGLVALLVAVGVTPVGQEWLDGLPELLHDLTGGTLG